MVIGLAAAAVVRAVRGRAAAGAVAAPETPPEPLFPLPFAGAAAWAAGGLRAVRLPDQYRSLLRPSLLERAGSGPPWFWALVTAALVFAVTR